MCRRAGSWPTRAGGRSRAISSDGHVHLERFGDKYLTAFNDSPDRRAATITLDDASATDCRELLSGARHTIDHGKLALTLEGEDVAVQEPP